jgi:hypothetical protein
VALRTGELLRAAEEAGFDVPLTGDQSMAKEQNLAGRNLAIVTLSAIEWPIIQPHVGKIAAAIVTAKPGTVTRVDVGALFGRAVRPARIRDEGRHELPLVVGESPWLIW